MPVPVYWLEPTRQVQVSLRRYDLRRAKSRTPCPLMPGEWSYHNASVVIGTAPARWKREKWGGRWLKHLDVQPMVSHRDRRWPRSCGCGYRFRGRDTWQTNGDLFYRGAPDGKLYTLRDAPPGAAWDAWWMNDLEMFTGPDGIALMVRTPGGDWNVDGEASNCTRTQYVAVDGGKRWSGRTHYCWIRHGDPRTPATLHVDKEGNTCSAGAGSIQAGSYHGFLHNGQLT